MAVTIYTNKFMDNLEWSDLKTTSNIGITSFYLIDDKIGAWYEYIERQTFGITENSGPVKCGLFE